MKAPSLLRYPGGKSKVRKALVNRMEQVDAFLDTEWFVEPFCGGASVALEVASRYPAISIHLNDLNPRVAALWRVVADKEGHALELLLERIEDTTPTVDEFRRCQAMTAGTALEMAWACLYLNRTAFSGKAHTSPVGGWEQDSKGRGSGGKGAARIDAEWRPELHVRQLIAIHELLAGRCEVSSMDVRGALQAHPDCYAYLDPPYVGRGPSMYGPFGSFDHVYFAGWLRGFTLAGGSDWLLSYDDSLALRGLYRDWTHINTLDLPYSASARDRNTKRELLIQPHR